MIGLPFCLLAENFAERSSTIAAASIAVSMNGLRCWGAGRTIVKSLVDDKVSLGHVEIVSTFFSLHLLYEYLRQP